MAQVPGQVQKGTECCWNGHAIEGDWRNPGWLGDVVDPSFDEARFADAHFAADEHDSSLASPGVVEPGVQLFEVGGAFKKVHACVRLTGEPGLLAE